MFTKKMAEENRKMEARARELYPDKGNGLIIEIIQAEFPQVSEARIKRMAGKVSRYRTARNHGGKRPNQTGRPPLPPDERRDWVIRLRPGYQEKAQQCAVALGLSAGRATEEALDRLARNLGMEGSNE